MCRLKELAGISGDNKIGVHSGCGLVQYSVFKIAESDGRGRLKNRMINRSYLKKREKVFDG